MELNRNAITNYLESFYPSFALSRLKKVISERVSTQNKLPTQSEVFFRNTAHVNEAIRKLELSPQERLDEMYTHGISDVDRHLEEVDDFYAWNGLNCSDNEEVFKDRLFNAYLNESFGFPKDLTVEQYVDSLNLSDIIHDTLESKCDSLVQSGLERYGDELKPLLGKEMFDYIKVIAGYVPTEEMALNAIKFFGQERFEALYEPGMYEFESGGFYYVNSSLKSPVPSIPAGILGLEQWNQLIKEYPLLIDYVPDEIFQETDFSNSDNSLLRFKDFLYNHDPAVRESLKDKFKVDLNKFFNNESNVNEAISRLSLSETELYHHLFNHGFTEVDHQLNSMELYFDSIGMEFRGSSLETQRLNHVTLMDRGNVDFPKGYAFEHLVSVFSYHMKEASLTYALNSVSKDQLEMFGDQFVDSFGKEMTSYLNVINGMEVTSEIAYNAVEYFRNHRFDTEWDPVGGDDEFGRVVGAYYYINKNMKNPIQYFESNILTDDQWNELVSKDARLIDFIPEQVKQQSLLLEKENGIEYEYKTPNETEKSNWSF